MQLLPNVDIKVMIGVTAGSTYCRWWKSWNSAGGAWTAHSSLYWLQRPGTCAVVWTCIQSRMLAVHTTEQDSSLLIQKNNINCWQSLTAKLHHVFEISFH